MMISALKTFWQEEDGQDMVEYALLLGFISLASIAFMGNVRGAMQNFWNTIANQLNNASNHVNAGQ